MLFSVVIFVYSELRDSYKYSLWTVLSYQVVHIITTVP
jgi:hypothetical protein